jgi:hypothetical protein
MTDLQWLALLTPVALLVLVSIIVALEEVCNVREMRREKARSTEATVKARMATHAWPVTVTLGIARDHSATRSRTSSPGGSAARSA